MFMQAPATAGAGYPQSRYADAQADVICFALALPCHLSTIPTCDMRARDMKDRLLLTPYVTNLPDFTKPLEPWLQEPYPAEKREIFLYFRGRCTPFKVDMGGRIDFSGKKMRHDLVNMLQVLTYSKTSEEESRHLRHDIMFAKQPAASVASLWTRLGIQLAFQESQVG